MAPTLTLRSAAGERSFPVTATLTIGRAPDNDVRIDDPGASRYHASLTFAEPYCLFVDLGSSNGSRVNGVAVQPRMPVPIHPGDTIAIAETTLEVVPAPVAATVSLPAPVAASEPAVAMEPVPPAVSSQAALPVPEPRPSRSRPARSRGVVTSGLLAFAVGCSFALFLLTNATATRLLQPDYYKGVLEHSNAYQRAYTELTKDPALSGEVNDLVGGVDVLPEELTGAVAAVVPDLLLKEIVEEAIDRLIAYLKHHSSLDLSLDITPVVDSSLGNVVTFATDMLFGRPVRQAPTYEAFVADLQQTVDGIKQNGKLPDVIPGYEVPRAKRAEVSGIIKTAAGLDPAQPADAAIISDIDAAVADDDIEEALKAGMGRLLKDSTGDAREGLIHGEFVRETTVDGQRRYVLGPPEKTTRDIQRAVWIIYTVSWTAGWGRLLAILAGLSFLGLLVKLRYPDTIGMARWVGGTFLASGAALLAAWFIGSALLKRQIVSAALGDSSLLPATYQRLFRDVLDTAVSDLAPTFVVPCLVVALAGAALLGLAVAMTRRSAAEGPGLKPGG